MTNDDRSNRPDRPPLVSKGPSEKIDLYRELQGLCEAYGILVVKDFTGFALI